MDTPKPLIFDLTAEELRDLCASWGWPIYRADQVLTWVYRDGVLDPTRMTNLGKLERQQLAERLRLGSGTILHHQTATDGTQKLLIQWDHVVGQKATAMPQTTDPARQTETVMIPTPDRRTACISSQVGCPVGCRFCASGMGGLDGNLSRGQIVEQVWRLNQLTRELCPRNSTELPGISNVVFMGMGEPLSNLTEVIAAARTLSTLPPGGLGISARKITISTVGLPAQIRRLAEQELPVTLAISLHAPNDELRRQLIPWAEFVTIAQITEAGQHYFDKTGREVTLEYLLLGSVNDQPQHAAELARVAKSLRANVNLIRYNQVAGLPYLRPEDNDVLAFQARLKKAGVNTHIRASRGRDIAAACGQLRHEKKGLGVGD
ncbi:MAG: 23S rRNA (adenine(2503)-C(2))-methyltransferase RlmN [Phycisphaeraceae bacterium]|nr:23S rRNA (adenine(2503)-C(2))-methyltransferase RlmN [Phycisphaeraceae bacterium]